MQYQVLLRHCASCFQKGVEILAENMLIVFSALFYRALAPMEVILLFIVSHNGCRKPVWG